MRPIPELSWARFPLWTVACLFTSLSFGATSGQVHLENFEVVFATELSREIPWFNPGTGSIVRRKIVRRFSLFCFEGTCSLDVISFPASNCWNAISGAKSDKPLLEAASPGSDTEVFETHIDGSGDLSVSARGSESVLVEFTSHEPHRSKNSLLITYRNGPGTKVPVRVSGRETGVGQNNSLYVGGNEVVSFEYRQLPASTVCAMNMQTNDVDKH